MSCACWSDNMQRYRAASVKQLLLFAFCNCKVRGRRKSSQCSKIQTRLVLVGGWLITPFVLTFCDLLSAFFVFCYIQNVVLLLLLFFCKFIKTSDTDT